MKRLLLAGCALLGFLSAAGLVSAQIRAPQRSVSASRQFVIYCDDLAMRLAVSTFAEKTKTGVLKLLDQDDQWKIPIVISLTPRDITQPGQPASQVRLFEIEDGSKIELDVALGGDLAEARFQQQLVRAILIGLEYRGRHAVKAGAVCVEPPQWLVEGLTACLRSQERDVDAVVYKTLLKNNRLPAIQDFLNQNTNGMNPVSLKLYQACSMSLFQLLADLPEGRAGLAAYLRDLPLGEPSASTTLMKHFPALGGSEQNLEKWWALSMARFSASDRYKGLLPEETERRLVELLNFTIPSGKKGEVKNFAIEDFKEFVKLPEAPPVLANAGMKLQDLAAQASPLFRPVVGEYHAIVTELQRGKIKRTTERLKTVAKYREMVLLRMDQIADYLNWFEATQMVNRSNSFDDYMRTAREISSEPPKRDDPISRYLDRVELELQ